MNRKRIILLTLNAFLVGLFLYLSGYRFSKEKIYREHLKAYDASSYQVIYENRNSAMVLYDQDLYRHFYFNHLFPLVKNIDNTNITYPFQGNFTIMDEPPYQKDDLPYTFLLSTDHYDKSKLNDFIFFLNKPLEENQEIKISTFQNDNQRVFLEILNVGLIQDKLYHITINNELVLYPRMEVYQDGVRHFSSTERDLQNIHLFDQDYGNKTIQIPFYSEIHSSYEMELESFGEPDSLALVFSYSETFEDQVYTTTYYQFEDQYYELFNSSLYRLDTTDFSEFIQFVQTQLVN